MVSDRTGGVARGAAASLIAALVMAVAGAIVWASAPGPSAARPDNHSQAAQAYTWDDLIQSVVSPPSTQLLSDDSDLSMPKPQPQPQTNPAKVQPSGGIDVQFDSDGGEITVKPSDKGGTVLVSGENAPKGGLFVRPVNGPTTSAFGIRFHPVLRVWKLHTGTDFGVACGTPVGAAAAGTVVFTGWGGGNGWRVVVDHGRIDGHRVQTTYNHLSMIGVRVGQKVVPHQLLAKVGNTGYSTGCHLHFEVMVDGRFADPMPWLTGKPSTVKPGPLPDLTPDLPEGEELNTKPDDESTVGTDAPPPASETPTPSPTPTPTPSQTPGASETPTPSGSPDPSADPSATGDPSAEPSGSTTPDPEGTPGPTPTESPSSTPTPTESSSPSPSPSLTPQPSPTPVSTPSPSASKTPASANPSPTPTPSSTPTPSAKPSEEP